MHSMISANPSKPWPDIDLPRLSHGLLISLILHLILGLWLAGTPGIRPEAKFGRAQSLQLTLQGPSQNTQSAPAPVSKASAAPGAPDDSGIFAAEDAVPAALPAPSVTDQMYVAPDDVEEMAFVVDVEELPLPEGDQTPSGALYLKIMIGESGIADRIEILTSTLPEHYAATLVNSFYQATFSPARTAGLPVRSWRIIEIRFGEAEPAPS